MLQKTNQSRIMAELLGIFCRKYSLNDQISYLSHLKKKRKKKASILKIIFSFLYTTSVPCYFYIYISYTKCNDNYYGVEVEINF